MARLHRLLFAGAIVCSSILVVAQHEKPFAAAGEDSRTSGSHSMGSSVSTLNRLTEAITKIAERFQELSQELVHIAQKWASKGKDALLRLKQRLLEFNDKMKTWAREKSRKFEERSEELEDEFRQKIGKLKIWASEAPEEDRDYRFGERKFKSFVKKAFEYFENKDADVTVSGAEDALPADKYTSNSRNFSDVCSDGANLEQTVTKETIHADMQEKFHAEVNRLIEVLRSGIHMYADLDKMGAADDVQKVKDELHNSFMEAILYALQTLNEFCGMEFRAQDVDELLEIFKAAGANKPAFVQLLISNTADALDHARVDATQSRAFCKQDSNANGESIDACMSKVCSNADKIVRSFGVYMRSKRK